MRIIDITNPAAPTEVGSYDPADFLYDVAVAGHYAYLVDPYNGLQIIDLSNQAAPTKVGAYDLPGRTSGVVVDGHYAYLINSTPVRR